MKRTTAVAVALFTALAMLGVGACSSDDDKAAISGSSKSGSKEVGKTPKLSGDDAKLADVMVENMTADDSMPLTEEQARCYANRSIDILGADRFEKAGLTAETINDENMLDYSDMKVTDGEANKVYDQFEACGINLREAMLAGFQDDGDMTPESKECFEEALTEDNVRKFMVTTMVKGEEAFNDEEEGLMGEIMACAFLDMDDDSFSGEMDIGDYDFDSEESGS